MLADPKPGEQMSQNATGSKGRQTMQVGGPYLWPMSSCVCLSAETMSMTIPAYGSMSPLRRAARRWGTDVWIYCVTAPSAV